MRNPLTLRIAFAEHCAWRAIYVYRPVDVETGFNRWSDVQICRLGFDPGDCGRASIFFAIGNRSGRIRLPHSRRWARLDGRNAYYAAQRDLRNRGRA